MNQDPSAAYLNLFTPRLTQSEASRAYHARCMEPNDQMLWLSRLRRPQGANWLSQLAQHGIKPRGVLHVGAHYGLELETYLAEGCERVTFFEASPLVLGQLKAHVAFWRDWLEVLGVPERLLMEVVECAVSDHQGQVDMHVAELEMLSSLQQPSADWIKIQATVPVSCAPLDTLVSRRGDFNLLNLDVQGHEMQVLRGARAVLAGLEGILIELNYVPRYQGGAVAEEVERWLTEAGFECIGQTRYGDVADALFVRR